MPLNPVSFPSCQSFKKLSVIHKDRFLFKVDPSKGTCIFNEENINNYDRIHLQIPFTYTMFSDAQCPAHRCSAVFTKGMDEETAGQRG